MTTSSSSPHHASLSPSARYRQLLRPEFGEFRVVILFAIVGAILYLAVPVTVDAFLSNVMFGTIMQPLLVLTTALLGCLLFLGVLQALQAYAVEVIQRRLFVRVAGDFAWRLPRLKREAVDRVHAPELVNRFLETAILQKKTASLLSYAVNTVLTTLVGMAVLGFFHPVLLGFALVLLAGLAIIVIVFGRGGVRTAVNESYSKYAVVDWLEEIVRHETVFATRDGVDLAKLRTEEYCRTYLKNRIKHFRILFRQIVGGLFLQVFAATAVLGLGGFLVLDQQLTVGQLVASELIVSGLVANVAKIGQVLESWYDACAAADKIGHVIDLPLERAGGIALSESTQPFDLEAHSLRYSYDNVVTVFENFHMRVKAGERVALHTTPGAGATTLFDLLYGLREAQAGHLLWAGLDLRQIDLLDLRDRIELVRHPEIVEGSVLENLRLSRDNLSIEAAWFALDCVELRELVLAMPNGIDTPLASGGPTLSSGEALRLTLARSIAREPQVLLLDDVLDRLDRSLRGRIASRLLARELDWTVIVSTELDEVAALCDRIVRLPEGEGALMEPVR